MGRGGGWEKEPLSSNLQFKTDKLQSGWYVTVKVREKAHSDDE